MAKIGYKLGIGFYKVALQAAAPFNEKAALFLKGRKNVFEDLKKAFDGNTSPVAWFHCASLGEFEQGRPIIEEFRREYPTYKVLVTFFSPSGYEVRKNYDQADVVCYLPLDTAANAKKLLDIVNPAIAFFVKYEFWHYYLAELKKRNIPTLSVSAIFRQGQAFFKPYGGFYRNILKNLTHIFVQDQTSADLLTGIGLRNVTVAGDSRFDRVKQVVDSRKDLPIAQAFKNNQKTLVIGSSWQPDIEVISKGLENIGEELKIIIAPHEIADASLTKTEEAFSGKKIIRYSKASVDTVATYDILLIDNIGMLTSLYQYGDFAYVGGAFGKGLHNILEAATYGMPVIFGSKYAKFKEARDLVALKGVFSINNVQEFHMQFEKLFENETERQKAGDICKQYVKENTGATAEILNFCKRLLK
ncbi:glycosyltransferase N-terminal domain-containing protein [Limibacter armeniacum]|uniref:3-deoxy-D-manno-octulosonic acid transferase n=1 Tax=Limibacter armeniacum TaxID=466084 RepID=UPI002FE554D2